MLVVRQCISKTLLIEISVDETLQIQRIFKKWMGLPYIMVCKASTF